MTVPHHNWVGSILYLKKKQKATRCNSGDKILPYMLRLIFENFFMDRHYVYFFLFFRNLMKTSRYLINSIPYSSGTSQNDFRFKETDKRGQKGDKKRSKTL
jgi:hypothetical protein